MECFNLTNQSQYHYTGTVVCPVSYPRHNDTKACIRFTLVQNEDYLARNKSSTANNNKPPFQISITVLSKRNVINQCNDSLNEKCNTELQSLLKKRSSPPPFSQDDLSKLRIVSLSSILNISGKSPDVIFYFPMSALYDEQAMSMCRYSIIAPTGFSGRTYNSIILCCICSVIIPSGLIIQVLCANFLATLEVKADLQYNDDVLVFINYLIILPFLLCSLLLISKCAIGQTMKACIRYTSTSKRGLLLIKMLSFIYGTMQLHITSQHIDNLENTESQQWTQLFTIIAKKTAIPFSNNKNLQECFKKNVQRTLLFICIFKIKSHGIDQTMHWLKNLKEEKVLKQPMKDSATLAIIFHLAMAYYDCCELYSQLPNAIQKILLAFLFTDPDKSIFPLPWPKITG